MQTDSKIIYLDFMIHREHLARWHIVCSLQKKAEAKLKCPAAQIIASLHKWVIVATGKGIQQHNGC